jgi:hypothetical protein
MRIKWGNVLAILIGVPLAVIVWTHRDDIARFFAAIESIGPGHSPDEQTRGLLALGLVAVAIAVVVRNLRTSGPAGGGTP